MSTELTIEGYENMMNILKGYPENGYRKPITAAFRKAATPVKDAMVRNLPSYLKRMKKIIKIKPGKGKTPSLTVGAFGRQGVYMNSRGQRWDPYMLLYWHNYGTLQERAPGHRFKKAISRKSTRKKGGLKAGLFFEKAVEESLPKAADIFEKSFEEELEKWLEKEAAK